MNLDEVGGYEPPYKEYELRSEERESLRQIKKCLDEGSCSLHDLRDLLNYVEDLQTKIRDILRAEETKGYSNETLKHDFRKITEIAKRMANELERMDA